MPRSDVLTRHLEGEELVTCIPKDCRGCVPKCHEVDNWFSLLPSSIYCFSSFDGVHTAPHSRFTLGVGSYLHTRFGKGYCGEYGERKAELTPAEFTFIVYAGLKSVGVLDFGDLIGMQRNLSETREMLWKTTRPCFERLLDCGFTRYDLTH